MPGTFDDDSVFTRLEEVLKEFDEAGIAFNRVFYLPRRRRRSSP